MNNYAELKKRLAKGWNTWNTYSVLSHALLPQGFSINLAIKEHKRGDCLREALIGRQGEHDEVIFPGMHSYDGSYTELNFRWRDMEIIVRSGTENEDIVILATPLKNQQYPASLAVWAGMLWNRKGYASLGDDGGLVGCFDSGRIPVYITEEEISELNFPIPSPYIAVRLDRKIGISSGRKRNVQEIEAILKKNKNIHAGKIMKYGKLGELYNAMQTCLAWDTIYEPSKDRIVTPVSRIWNVNNGGYALFCWDTYFAAYMLSVDNRDLAYANAIEITKEKTAAGFVPNVACGSGFVSLDRSQPPVGSMVVRELYRKYRDIWLLEELFYDLLEWNRWFNECRNVGDGTLAWGSNPYKSIYGNYWETAGVGHTFGGALESGLDNSPMYDNVRFNTAKNIMELSDVGLTGLYVMDCHALSDIARILGKEDEACELEQRACRFERGLDILWNEEIGMYLNKFTDTGHFSNKISPTNFYALFSDSIAGVRIERLLKEYFYNESKFWGKYILPSIARDDPAYAEQDYWRGRIWAPMNFLVYLALRKHSLDGPSRDLAEKSACLLLKEWLKSRHVHENYSAETGEGCDKPNSDRFYHWGALLSLIALIEEGYVEGPEKPL